MVAASTEHVRREQSSPRETNLFIHMMEAHGQSLVTEIEAEPAFTSQWLVEHSAIIYDALKRPAVSRGQRGDVMGQPAAVFDASRIESFAYKSACVSRDE